MTWTADAAGLPSDKNLSFSMMGSVRPRISVFSASVISLVLAVAPLLVLLSSSLAPLTKATAFRLPSASDVDFAVVSDSGVPSFAKPRPRRSDGSVGRVLGLLADSSLVWAASGVLLLFGATGGVIRRILVFWRIIFFCRKIIRESIYHRTQCVVFSGKLLLEDRGSPEIYSLWLQYPTYSHPACPRHCYFQRH